MCCADFGDPTTRRRFFLIGRSDGKRLTWPEFTHDRVGGTDLLGTRQTPRTHSVDDPMPTVTASGHVQLAQPAADLADEVVIDINYRMLHWRELARATSFDDEGEIYDFAGNATEITKQIGNAVPNRTAKALVMGLMRDAA